MIAAGFPIEGAIESGHRFDDSAAVLLPAKGVDSIQVLLVASSRQVWCVEL
jgi:hypothetical protein